MERGIVVKKKGNGKVVRVICFGCFSFGVDRACAVCVSARSGSKRKRVRNGLGPKEDQEGRRGRRSERRWQRRRLMSS